MIYVCGQILFQMNCTLNEIATDNGTYCLLEQRIAIHSWYDANAILLFIVVQIRRT